MRRVRVTVRGRVQGVFFRVTCAEAANELGLAGSVSNLADGSVLVEFQGDPAAVTAGVDWCRKGPPMAVVTSVEVIEQTPQAGQGSATDFLIVG